MEAIDKSLADNIIHTIGESGQPPQFGYKYFSIGLENYINALDENYFSSYIKQGGSAFKLVVSAYGGGKTHFLYTVRDIAWGQNYVVSYVTLSASESPFHQLDTVYKAIINNIIPLEMMTEEQSSRGISSLLKSWYASKRKYYSENTELEDFEILNEIEKEITSLSHTDSVSFSNAIKSAIRALIKKNQEDFDVICQWLSGEGFDKSILQKYKIYEKIDRRTAFKMIRSLTQVLRQLDYSGLTILLDEAEAKSSLSTRQSEQVLINLRELIDVCTQSHFQGVMIFYAVPDENFLEGKTQIYDALRQRLETVFENKINPEGVKISLETFYEQLENPKEFLSQIGEKIADIYKVAKDIKLNESELKITIGNVAEFSYEKRFASSGYVRLFVQKLIYGLNFLNIKGKAPQQNEIN